MGDFADRPRQSGTVVVTPSALNEARRQEVTVAIPAYNCAATLQRAIDSVLAQTYTAFELLIVDDCSTDGTANILARQTDARIRVIRHAHNLGEGGARNTCFHNARHPWLAFLDSDDEWFPEKLHLQVAALTGQTDDFCALFVPFERYNLDDGMRETICETANNENGDWVRHLLDQCGIGAGTTMLTSKRAHALVGPYDASLRRRTDHDWLLRFAVAGGRIVQLGGVTSARVYFTAKSRPETIVSATTIFLDKHASIYAAHPRGIARKARASLWFQVAESFAINRRYIEWCRIILRCLRLDPARALPELAKMLDRSFCSPVARLRRHFKS